MDNNNFHYFFPNCYEERRFFEAILSFWVIQGVININLRFFLLILKELLDNFS